jgi:hypothetical protein
MKGQSSHLLPPQESPTTNDSGLKIQRVGCQEDVFSIDWKFQVVKNYLAPGAAACFTSMVEAGEVWTLGLVSSTIVADIAHMVEQTRDCPNFRLKGIFTDACPANQDFWLTHDIWLHHRLSWHIPFYETNGRHSSYPSLLACTGKP